MATRSPSERENAQPGEYYITVDGGGPERWVSRGAPIELPPDPNNFVANNDLRENCWSDGGRDAFDCYGRTSLQFGNAAAASFDVSPGMRQGASGGYATVVEWDWQRDRRMDTHAAVEQLVHREALGRVVERGADAAQLVEREARLLEAALALVGRADVLPVDVLPLRVHP